MENATDKQVRLLLARVDDGYKAVVAAALVALRAQVAIGHPARGFTLARWRASVAASILGSVGAELTTRASFLALQSGATTKDALRKKMHEQTDELWELACSLPEDLDDLDGDLPIIPDIYPKDQQ